MNTAAQPPAGAKVRCLACGEVFDASISVCPVCGASGEWLAPYVPETNAFRRESEEIFLIVGGGIAAVSAAAAIRERNRLCSVVLFSEEAVLPYNRPMLTKAMFDSLAEEALAIHPRRWYEEHGIYLMLSKRVVSLLPEERELVTDDGAHFHYDKCILATGASCFIPPIEGTGLAGVVAIRNVTDAATAARRAEAGQNAVVIGGGVLGLEAAWALKKAGCHVTVLENSPRLMMRNLDAAASALLQAAVEESGVAVVYSAQTDKINGTETVESVTLRDGTVLSADLVVVSCGVRANTALAQSAGIETGRAVVVDEHMETNLRGVYACGDCAEFRGVNRAVWPVAAEMGACAGANAAGEAAVYAEHPVPFTFSGMGTAVFTSGAVSGADGSQTAEFTDPQTKTMKKYFFRDGKLSGFTLIGDISAAAGLSAQLGKPLAWDEI